MYSNFCSTFAYILVEVFSDFGGIAKGKAASEIYPLTSLKIHLRLYFNHWNTRNYTEARGDVSIRQLRQQDISILRVSVLVRGWYHLPLTKDLSAVMVLTTELHWFTLNQGYTYRVSVSIRAHLWEIEAHVVFSSEKPPFSHIFNKKSTFCTFYLSIWIFFRTFARF